MRYQNSRKKLILLTLFTGWIGGHRYYLGQYTLGFLYTLFCWTGIPLALSLIDLIVIVSAKRKQFFKKYYRSDSNKEVNHFKDVTVKEFPFQMELTLNNLLASLHFTPDNVFIYKWLRVNGQPIQEGEPICQVVVEDPDSGKLLLWKLASPKNGILRYAKEDHTRISPQDILGHILYKPIMLKEGAQVAPEKPEISLDMEKIWAKEKGASRHPVWASIYKSIDHDIIKPVEVLLDKPWIKSIRSLFSFSAAKSLPFSSKDAALPQDRPQAPPIPPQELVEVGGEGSF